MQRGYIKIWRKLEDSGLLQLHGTLALFMYMLMNAAYKPCRYGTVDLERGQLVSGRHKLGENVGLSEQKVRTSLEHLIEMGMITSNPTNKYTIYTIVNYRQYQDGDDDTNQQDNQQLTNNQPTTNQQITTNKEIKKVRSKEYIDIFPEIAERQLVEDWIAIRKSKKLVITKTAMNGIQKEADKAGWSITDVLRKCCEKGWGGFEAKWVKDEVKPSGTFDLNQWMKDKQ